MTDDKVFKPTEIQDTPFPNQDTNNQSTSQSTTNGVYSQQATSDTPLPQKRIASEVLGTTLNTSARKILAEYEFSPSGAIQIGKYDPGVTGDLRISPDGVVARNKQGETTIVIEGDTGDVTIKGTITASVVRGSLIEGSEITGTSLTLGGSNNEFGLLSIRSSTNSETVRLDQNGVTLVGRTLFLGSNLASPEAAIYFTGSVFGIDYLNGAIKFETDTGPFTIASGGVLNLISATTVYFKNTDGTIYGSIDTSGNLKIKGTLTQNYVF